MPDPLTIAILSIVAGQLLIKIYKMTIKSDCFNNVKIDMHKSFHHTENVQHE